MCNINYLCFSKRVRESGRAGKSDDVNITINKGGYALSFSVDALKKIGIEEGQYIKIGYAPDFKNRLYIIPCEGGEGYKVTKNNGKKPHGSRFSVRFPLKAMAEWDFDLQRTTGRHFILKDKENHAFIEIK
jgi:hypothetical protein